MSTVIRSANRTAEHIEALKAAIATAREQGIRVRVGPCGVYPVSSHAAVKWEQDPLCADGAVDAIGALILASQPPAMTPGEAAAQALGVDLIWLEGLLDGMDLGPKEPQWIHSPRRELYLKAYEAGAVLRIHVQSLDRPRSELAS